MSVERFVDLWNEGRLEEALAGTAPDYTYSDGLTDGPVSRDEHLDLMRRYLQLYPDRRIELTSVVVEGKDERATYVWRGTPADGGPPLERAWSCVFRYDDEGRLREQTHTADS